MLLVTVRLPVVTVDAESGDVEVNVNDSVPLKVNSLPVASTFAIFEEYVMHNAFLDVYLVCCYNALYIVITLHNDVDPFHDVNNNNHHNRRHIPRVPQVCCNFRGAGSGRVSGKKLH